MNINLYINQNVNLGDYKPKIEKALSACNKKMNDIEELFVGVETVEDLGTLGRQVEQSAKNDLSFGFKILNRLDYFGNGIGVSFH